MKKQVIFSLIIILFFLGCAVSKVEKKPTTTLFFDDFESGLKKWTKGHAKIVADPLEKDKALAFWRLNSAGDIWTTKTLHSSTGNYILTFDYLGKCGKQGCGGFIGYDPGDVWLGGTGPGYTDIVRLLDTGKWEGVSITFKGPKNIKLKIEDFSGSGGAAGDAFFDNIRLMEK
jgi:hypothetical protein